MTDIQPEERLESETVFEGNLITVRKDTVRLPNGKTSIREVVEHTETIAVLPILDDGRIVFVRQFRESVGRALLEIPAGGIDGEESPEEAVRREMKEETGYSVGALDHLCSYYVSPGYTTEYQHLYLARELQPGEPTEEDDELQVERVPQDEALYRLWHGEIVDAKTIAALALYAQQISTT